MEEEPEDEEQGAGEGVSAADEAAAAVERMATHGAASTSAPDDRSGKEWLSPGAEAGLRRLDSLVDDWGLVRPQLFHCHLARTTSSHWCMLRIEFCKWQPGRQLSAKCFKVAMP